jgi:hypothetical protein
VTKQKHGACPQKIGLNHILQIKIIDFVLNWICQAGTCLPSDLVGR